MFYADRCRRSENDLREQAYIRYVLNLFFMYWILLYLVDELNVGK